MTYASPYFFLLLLLPILWHIAWHRRRCRRAAVGYSSLTNARSVPRTWRVRLACLPMLILDASAVALIIALARPQTMTSAMKSEDAKEGIAIEMVLDRSASMMQEMAFEGRRTTRLETVKKIFSRFVFGDDTGTFQGRPNDLVGLVTFAKTAETTCPLTLGHDALKQALAECVLIPDTHIEALKKAQADGLDINSVIVQTDRFGAGLQEAFAQLYGKENAKRALAYFTELEENNRTAIGDALALGLARLKQIDSSARAYTVVSKVLILLTDGENNYGREVSSVVNYAKECNVKVYILGIGDIRELKADPALSRLAQETGGRFLIAHSAEELNKIYQDIDAMEKSEIKETQYINYQEAFPKFLLLSMMLLILHILLRTTLFRNLP